MKRILSVLLVVLMISLTLVACDRQKAVDPNGTTTIEQDPNAPANQPKEPEQQAPEQPANSPAAPEEKPEETPAEPEKLSEPEKPASAPTPDTATEASEKAAAIASTAESLIGTAYRLGGVGPEEFDNSGFVYYCCKQNGVDVPRLASGMATAGKEIKAEDVKKGDIVVFTNEIGGSADFVGIYVGSGKFISCNNPEQPTAYQNFNAGYWQERFVSARRVA